MEENENKPVKEKKKSIIGRIFKAILILFILGVVSVATLL